MDEMTPEECRRLLAGRRTCTLGLSKAGRAYVLPLFYAFDGRTCWFQSHPGTKDEYLASTEEACLVVMRVEDEDDWESVQAFGPVEKVTLTDEVRAAKNALLDVPYPPEAGSYPKGTPRRSDQSMYYWKLTPRRIAGRSSRSRLQRRSRPASGLERRGPPGEAPPERARRGSGKLSVRDVPVSP